MALNIKNAEVERLAAEVAGITGESKTEAVLNSLKERRQKLLTPLERQQRFERAWKWLEEEIWPNVDPKYLGKGMSQKEQDEVLGYGPEGYCV